MTHRIMKDILTRYSVLFLNNSQSLKVVNILYAGIFFKLKLFTIDLLVCISFSNFFQNYNLKHLKHELGEFN